MNYYDEAVTGAERPDDDFDILNPLNCMRSTAFCHRILPFNTDQSRISSKQQIFYIEFTEFSIPNITQCAIYFSFFF